MSSPYEGATIPEINMNTYKFMRPAEGSCARMTQKTAMQKGQGVRIKMVLTINQ